MTQIGSTLLGIDVMGRLWKYDTDVNFFMTTGDFEGKNVREALNATLQAFNLIAIVSSTKAAYVYRRGNDTGVPQTSGNTLEITTSDPSNLKRLYSYLTKVEFVKLSNGLRTVTYDGSTFGSAVLSNTRSIEIDNPLIPDELLEDFAFRIFKYFERDWTMYEIPLDNVPLYQFEPFDECSIAFTGTKVLVSDSGPIYGVTIHPNCSMTVRVLIGSDVDPY